MPKHLGEGKGSSDVDTVNDVTMGGFPTVFISYNWGKQTLVCTHTYLINSHYKSVLGLFHSAAVAQVIEFMFCKR